MRLTFFAELPRPLWVNGDPIRQRRIQELLDAIEELHNKQVAWEELDSIISSGRINDAKIVLLMLDRRWGHAPANAALRRKLAALPKDTRTYNPDLPHDHPAQPLGANLSDLVEHLVGLSSSAAEAPPIDAA